MFVGTWNVGGRPPHSGLNLRDWLMSTPSSPDIYVLGDMRDDVKQKGEKTFRLPSLVPPTKPDELEKLLT
ncbi:hypothetical protein BHE74_00001747 [Ensete ventricosum]|nr:hypothetical protein GW17_00004846 [Ensete ventricosum]RWW89317.1 hypothetical protein BHE74_00001747 [Ensete ventricosum]